MKLADYLKMRGINQSKAAAEVSTSPAAMSLMIRGLRAPRAPLAKRIVLWSGGVVSFNDLYGVTVTDDPPEAA